MKTTTYTAEMLSADFEENTITFLIDGDFSVKAGKYFIFSKEDLQNFADRICEKQRESCIESIDKFCCCRYIEEVEEYIVKGTIKSCEQPKIEEL
jgi:hypothetical protein